MTDIVSPEQRSKNMSAIRSKDTRPELYFRKLLFAEGFRYSLNSKNIPGHPDLYLRRFHTAVFIHGCFWHRHYECQYAYMPKTRIEFWQKKFDTNTKRDAIVQKELLDRKIKCLIVWECTIKKMSGDETVKAAVLKQTVDFLHSGDLRLEL